MSLSYTRKTGKKGTRPPIILKHIIPPSAYFVKYYFQRETTFFNLFECFPGLFLCFCMHLLWISIYMPTIDLYSSRTQEKSLIPQGIRLFVVGLFFFQVTQYFSISPVPQERDHEGKEAICLLFDVPNKGLPLKLCFRFGVSVYFYDRSQSNLMLRHLRGALPLQNTVPAGS